MLIKRRFITLINIDIYVTLRHVLFSKFTITVALNVSHFRRFFAKLVLIIVIINRSFASNLKKS